MIDAIVELKIKKKKSRSSSSHRIARCRLLWRMHVPEILRLRIDLVLMFVMIITD